ncbi:MAG: N-acetylmuramoyl-L-alanine amidase [Cyanobacteriota bacterium]
MNTEQRPLLMAVAAAAVFSMVGLGWLARNLLMPPSNAGTRPSLLELLEEVRQTPSSPEAAPPARRPPPRPPAARNWTSPLRASGPSVPAQLRDRLQARLADLDREAKRLRIDPTNYGERYRRDAYGNPVDPTPRVIVLHETVYGLNSAINTFVTPHPRDDDQVSYHTLIGQKGEVVRVLDPARRAFGAGNSAFNGRWVVTNPRVGGSINNFALHLSLETPIDGEDEEQGHSGYTSSQYDAMAVVLADWMRRYSIPADHITTHRHVDLAAERADPRSFDWNQLQQRLLALGVSRC